MSFDEIETLKREWTDKYVVVDEDVPELRRFSGRTGIVKTVNMSGRALVEFQHRSSTINYPDVSWYDIDPSYLRVVDKPVEPAKDETPVEKPAAQEAKPAAAKKPSPPSSLPGGEGSEVKAKAGGKGKSPLELAREQGAAKSAAAAPSKLSKKTEGTKPAGKKLSPLELARQQGAAKRDDSPEPDTHDNKAESAEAAEQKPEPKQPAGKKLSPLELARQQGPAKRD